jgi:hypothetical protein
MIYKPFHSVLDMLIQKMTKKLQIIKVNKKFDYSEAAIILLYPTPVTYGVLLEPN